MQLIVSESIIMDLDIGDQYVMTALWKTMEDLTWIKPMKNPINSIVFATASHSYYLLVRLPYTIQIHHTLQNLVMG